MLILLNATLPKEREGEGGGGTVSYKLADLTISFERKESRR